MLEDWQVFIYVIVSLTFLRKHEQASIKVDSRHFDVILTPFSSQSEKIKANFDLFTFLNLYKSA